MKYTNIIPLFFLFFFCSTHNDKFYTQNNARCPESIFPDWKNSEFILPYAVGKIYNTGLSACSSSYHGVGMPDQFAVDFNMPIGDEITASISGEVIHVTENGVDYEFPNNLIVIKSGEIYVQYMHLTQDGAIVEVGDIVDKGDVIGYSGATGLAGYPHLHFVVTSSDGWEYPYESIPVTFSNTFSNPHSLNSYASYEALPY